MVVVERPWLERFLRQGGMRLLYGRRKTGKTFYARRVLRDHQYFIVMRGGKIYDPEADEVLETSSLLRLCRLGVKIILDEFHRAEPRLFDAIQSGTCSGHLVFITSTLHYYRRLVEGPDAPLKGMFSLRRVGLLTPLELLNTEWSIDDPARVVELTVFYQEPMLIGKSVREIIASGMDYARSLVGEVLSEEDHRYTQRFDAILEALAAGYTRLSEIASYLYSRGLIDKQSTGMVTKYLDLMARIGLVEKLPIWGKKRRSIYRHVSPLTDVAYYLNSRYEFYEAPLPLDFGLRVLEQRIPLLVEVYVERLLAQLYGLKPVKILEPEIDVALARFQHLEVVAEVKWVKKLSQAELRRIESKLYSINAKKHILVVPDADALSGETGLEVWDAARIVREARRARDLLENL